MKVLVTGGRGRLAEALAAASGEVIAAPRSRLDITDPAQIERELAEGGYDVVVNAAGVTVLEAAEAAPDHAHAVNTVAPGLLAEACARQGAPLVHLSTDYVFGQPTDRPWREDAPVSPVNVYGRSKAEGEARVLAAGPMGRIVRVAWLFGDERDFISRMLQVGRAGGVVTVANDQVGSPTPIGPLAERLLVLCRRLADGDDAIPQVLHLVGSPPASRAEWVSAAFDLLAAEGIEPPALRRVSMASFASTVVRPNFSALDSTLGDTLFGGPLDWKAGLAAAVRAGVYGRVEAE